MRSAYLGNLCPTLTGVTHLLEAQLLCRSPGSVGAALLGRWGRRSSLIIACGSLLSRSSGSGGSRNRDRGRGARGLLSWNLSGLGCRRGGRNGRCRSGGSSGGSSSGSGSTLTFGGVGLNGNGRRSWRRLGGRLLLWLVLDLLRLDSGGLALVLLHVLWLSNRLLRLLGLLGNMLRVLLRHVVGMLRVLRVLTMGVLGMLGMLLRRVLRDRHWGLNRVRVSLVMLCGCALLGILAVVDGVVATVQIRLGLRVSILLVAVPVGVSSKRRLAWCLHWHGSLGLRRPRRLLHKVSPLFLHRDRRKQTKEC